MKLKFLHLTLAMICIVAVSGVMFMENARASQPHMNAALEALQTAKAELNQAERDKGGHRTKAVELINRAIEQVNLGIAAGDRNE